MRQLQAQRQRAHVFNKHRKVSMAAESGTRQQRSHSAEVVRGRFYIPPAEVQQLQQAAGCSMDSLLLQILDEASHASRPCISQYRVGAVGLGGSGAVYIGANLEFPNNPLNQSVHAEQFLMANLVLHQERELHSIAISAAPCGHCRQFYSELTRADTVRFVFGYRGHTAPEVFGLDQLLPARFGPLDLLEDPSTPLLLQQQNHALAWSSTAQHTLQQRSQDAEFQQAAEAALAAAQTSYSPYTHCPAAVAIITKQGKVASGGYIESAAYNPGLPPFQAAVAGCIIAGCLDTYHQV
eukprot:GHRR01022638.1.p1 GENE.GHRR01022638.1~~GHRR01022638.1.p1  ORF type:complete len:295 (+),score=84.05 GHRR01022638.1:578-1462(+)